MLDKKTIFRAALCLCFVLILAGCSAPDSELPPTPIPAEYLPTAIALTLTANQVTPATPEPASVTDVPVVAVDSLQPEAEALAPTSSFPTKTYASPYTSAPTPTPVPAVPEAGIQIYRLGDLSKVTSPLRVTGYLKRGSVGPLLLELHGEDGRVLVRQVKYYEPSPKTWMNFSFDLEFEIPGPAEASRLVISTLDEKGRIKALNSVNLILLSMGEVDIYPPSALYESIVIKGPSSNSLITGGKILVSGQARTYSEQPLRAQILSEEGKVLGTRLINLSEPDENGYRTFAGEVPYQVSDLTTVRLLVYEDGEAMSDMAHLSSLEILLGP